QTAGGVCNPAAQDSRPQSLPLPLTARVASGHPEVEATHAPGPIGREEQRPAVLGQLGMHVVELRVQWWARVLGWGPGMIRTLTPRYPYVDTAERNRTPRPEEDFPGVGPERRRRVVEPRGVQLRHGLGGSLRTPVALYPHAIEVGLLEPLVSPIEVQSATAVTRHVLRSLLVVRGVDVGPQIHGRLPILLVRTPGSMRHINVERAHRAGPIA